MGKNSEVFGDRRKTPEDYRKIAALAPRLDGGELMQLTVGPRRDIERHEEAPDFMFMVLVIENDKDSDIALIAEMQVVEEDYFAAVTVSNMLRLDSHPANRLEQEIGELLGHWAAHTLYDFAVANIKSATIHHQMSTQMSLPLQPEDYHVYFYNREKLREAEKEES